jgi:hypothetical protein
MTCCYALIPDGNTQPTALFEALEDAMDFGLRRYGDDSFQIRFVEVVANPEPPALRVATA